MSAAVARSRSIGRPTLALGGGVKRQYEQRHGPHLYASLVQRDFIKTRRRVQPEGREGANRVVMNKKRDAQSAP